MKIYVVSRTLYGPDIEDDIGYVGARTEVMGAFTTEDAARDLQEEILNTSDYNGYPWDDPASVDPEETYIDAILEEVELDRVAF